MFFSKQFVSAVKKRMTFANVVYKPFFLTNAFVFGMAVTDARHVLLSGEDPSNTTPIGIAVAMKAMGASYNDTVGINAKSLTHAFVYCWAGYGDAVGKLGTIAAMKGLEGLEPDMLSKTFPNRVDIQNRKLAERALASQNKSHKQG